MPIIRQVSLFGIQELYDLEPTQRYEAIFSALDLEKIVAVVSKKSWRGAPVELNYPAMVCSLIARLVERIPTIKDLLKRLKNDLLFRVNCGFLISDDVLSEASYSRMIQKLSVSDVFDQENDAMILQALTEGFITDDHVAIDASHFEARDQAPAKEEKPKPEPKKRGRKTKAEQAVFDQLKKETKLNQTLFEKEVAAQLDATYEELRSEIPIEPQWGVKKNSEGKNAYWFGYKAHLAVGTKSQYIFQSLMSSGSLHDSKAAIPLLKGIEKLGLPIQVGCMDAGYDVPAIYQQLFRMNAQSVIAYNKRREQEVPGFNEHFAPTCVKEHAYRYDSFDPRWKTIKFTRPKECADCPLAQDSLCQKTFKFRIESDLRRYTAPARGSTKWKALFAERTAVERVNAYLKEFFQFNNVRHRHGKKAKLHLSLITFLFNASKLAAERINRLLQDKMANQQPA
ncbi:transposase [Jeotgalibacillus alimentarius]|uniref:transposase n=1 Tax=Jeotgalibacillus alimentarius TaxID=135826 RepID=UPI00059709C6|nr:transposase [Jeotgalibacillus alimentarius]